MKSLMTIAALALLAGCAGMGTSGGMGEREPPTPQEQYNDPTSPYFYGQG
jgi:uncharacterized lipoprotein YajG